MRIGSQGTIIMIEAETSPAPLTVTAGTKAKPATLSVAAAGAPVVGDIIVPRDTGWASIDGLPWKVSVVAAGVLTLEGSDTTRETNVLNTTGTPAATIEVPTFIELCRSSLTISQPAGTTIEMTTLCDTAHRIANGLPAIPTWTAAGFYDCDDAALDRAADVYHSGEKVVIDVRNPDGCGVTFMALVNTFDISWGVNAAIANTIGGQVDGRVNRYKTPAAGFVPLVARGSSPTGPSMATIPAPAPAEPVAP